MNLPLKRKYLEAAKGTQDFLGLNYYTEEMVKLKPTHFNPRKPVQIMDDCYYSPEAEVSDDGFIANVPEGFYRALRWSKGFDLPIIVTENGINDSTDKLRPRYLVEHLHQLWKAVNFSFPIKGYFHWSLVDNFEWERGWGQRFGLWELDLQTQARRKRPSADLYAEICRTNGISSETVARFAPELTAKLFPD